MAVVEVILPKWGLTMEDGTLVAWRKAEGESVKAGEIIAEVETEKITNELESPVDGVIQKLLVAEGTEEIAVGTVLCLIEQA
ncbi:MAG: biotin attachment protein [Anaerolineae bacterium]|nr:biotin attachment protein [Anaerolineae bacterium]